VLATIAERSSLPNRETVLVRVASPPEAALDFIELSFSKQYIGRSDMWRIKEHLTDQCIYSNQIITIEGMRMKLEVLFHSLCTQMPSFLLACLLA
jgi:hypothetical protein